MVTGKMHIDELGYPRAIFDPPNEIIGSFLEEDVQNSPLGCELLLQACDDVLEGRLEEWDDVGNAHRLTIRKDQVIIENEYSNYDPPCSLRVNDFKQLLLSWKSLIMEK